MNDDGWEALEGERRWIADRLSSQLLHVHHDKDRHCLVPDTGTRGHLPVVFADPAESIDQHPEFDESWRPT